MSNDIRSLRYKRHKVLDGEKKSIAGGSASWERVFDVSVPSDTLSLFIFHTDTLFKYDWDQIRSDYNILKRYDLSLEDLERLDFTITSYLMQA